MSLWMSLEHYIDGARNWERQRRYEPSLAKRVEGFTETLGEASTESSVHDNETTPPQVRLIQFRPAWGEQLILKVLNIPHVVLNSKYAVTEATGPLPLLQDLTHQTMMGGTTDIVEYLVEYTSKYYASSESNNNNDDAPHPLLPQHPDTLLYVTLIQEKLLPAWQFLQTQSPEWDQIYQPQSVRAGSWGAAWQARGWRRHVRLATANGTTTTEACLSSVRQVYRVLDQRLMSGFLLGKAAPTLADAYLFDHLIKALTDVHLVLVVAEFPHLIQFVQTIWDRYFAVDDASSDGWEIRNALENARNVFANIPLLPSNSNGNKDPKSFHHAVQLMEHLSIQNRQLQPALEMARQARTVLEGTPRRLPQEPFVTWHRWRRGGPYQASGAKPASTEEKNRRDYRHHDEAWMAVVAVGSVMSILLFGMARARE